MNLLSVLLPEYNLLQAAKILTQKHSIKVTPRHVKSHQDNDWDYDKLPWQAKLNCNCDSAAGSVCLCTECENVAHRHYTLPPGHGATLCIGGKYITAHLQKEVKEASYRSAMVEYIVKQCKMASGNLWVGRLGRSAPGIQKNQKGQPPYVLQTRIWPFRNDGYPTPAPKRDRFELPPLYCCNRILWPRFAMPFSRPRNCCNVARNKEEYFDFFHVPGSH